MATNLAPGQVIGGHFKLLKRLGSGGFGETFLCRDVHLPDSPYRVVKRLKPRNPAPEMHNLALRLFDNEAQMLYRLGSHDRIPQLFAHFSEEDDFFLVQEYVEGVDLSQEMLPNQKLPPSQVIDIMLGTLEVLSFVHQQNVIHRDLKPENIIRRDRDQQLVLIDFGVVKHLNTELEMLTSTNNLTVGIGTPGYMPSEQAQGEPKLASDIYAVGMIGIQALTGIPPYQLLKDANLEIIWQEYASDAPPQLITVINQMVRYDFRQRHGSADEALRAVVQCRQACGLGEPTYQTIANPDLPTVVTPMDPFKNLAPPTLRTPLPDALSDSLTNSNSHTIPQPPATNNSVTESDGNNNSRPPRHTLRDLSHIIPLFVKRDGKTFGYWQQWLGFGAVGTLVLGGIVLIGLSNQASAPKNSLGGGATVTNGVSPNPPLNHSNYRLFKTLLSHSDQVYAVGISPNGQWVASGSGDRSVIIWDRQTQKQKYTLKGHTDRIYDLGFSPNGQLLATGSSESTIKIWQVSSGKLLQTLTGHRDRIYTVLFQDDDTLFSSSADGTVRRWELQLNPKPQNNPKSNPQNNPKNADKNKPTNRTINVGTSVYDIAFSSDNKLVATANKDGEIVIWNLETGKAVQRLGDKNSPLRCIDISPNNKWIATGTEDGVIRLWSMQTEENYVLRGHTRTVHTIRFSPDGKTIASGSEDGTIRLWDVSERQVYQTLTEHSSGVSSIAFSRQGDWLVSGGFDNRVILWNRVKPQSSQSGK